MSVESIIQVLREGNVVIPKFFLKNYKRLQITDSEFLLIIHFFSEESGNKVVFDPRKIAHQMQINFEEVLELIDSLQIKGIIHIISMKNNEGLFSEYISLEPLFDKIAYVISDINIEIKNEKQVSDRKNIFRMFEKEFGRTLSPIEYEMIMKWIEDGHTEEIIVEALKESILNDVRSLKYIDRILIEWKRKNLTTVEKIREFNTKFKSRTNDQEVQQQEVFKYNWLENK